MANVLIGAPNFSDLSSSAQPNLFTPALSGGSWDAGNPLTNLQSRKLHLVARSSGVTEAQTVFTADLGTARPVRVVALPKHTISEAGRWRVRGFTALPILDSLTVGDAAWTAINTPTRSAAAYTGTDGMPMDLIGDDNGAALERYSIPVTFTGNATKVIAFRAKQGSSTTSSVELWDATASAIRMRCTITWTAGVPGFGFGGGSLISSTLIGDGVYRIVCLTASVTAANSHLIYVEGSNATPALTGDTYFASVMAWNAATDPLTYDSGFPLALPSGSTAETRAGLNVAAVAIVPSTATDARYWRVNIRDTANAAGYVDVARLIIAGGYQPTFNFSVGATVTTESETTRTVTDGGAAIYDTRPLRRVARFAVDNLEANEAWLSAWRVMKRLGASNQCFLVLDPDADADTMAETAFLCVPRELSVLEYTAPMFRSLGFAFTEEL